MGLENIEDRVFPHQPDVLFIEFAMNDAIKTRGTSVDQARKNLETMLDMTLKKFPKCEIILMSMNPDVKHLLLKRPASGRPNLPRYYAMYADVAKKRDLQFIDLFKAWNAFLKDDLDTMKKHIPDGVHPNGLGTKRVITPTVLMKAIGVAFEPKDIPHYPDRVKKRPRAKKPKKKVSQACDQGITFSRVPEALINSQQSKPSRWWEPEFDKAICPASFGSACDDWISCLSVRPCSEPCCT